jgi:RNA polymerase sigma factor (sigma-70 family)
MTKNNEIKKLWKRIIKGDSSGWQELIKIYSDLTFSIAHRVGLSRPDAEDCVQHIWLTLYKRRHSIKDPVALPAWLIQSTHRHAVYMAKRLSRPIPSKATSLNQNVNILPDQQIIELEKEAVIKYAMSRLDTRCQKLIYELFLSPDQKSYKQIARSLKIKPNTLGPLRSRCLKKLEKILNKIGYNLD